MCKDGHNKGQKWFGPNKAEEIKTRWQEDTEELHKNKTKTTTTTKINSSLNDPDNHSGVFTHLELNILEREVEGSLGSITMNKASGNDIIPADLLKILKDDAVKDLHSISANLDNSAVAIALEKVRFHSSFKEGQCQRMFKIQCNCSFHVLGRLCSKSFKLGFNNM